MKIFLVAGALVAFAGTAVARDDPFPRRFKPDQFPQVVEQIETNMQPGGKYEAKADEQAKVRALLAEIATLLEGNERLADLDEPEKAAIEKRRSGINALLSDNAKKEVVEKSADRKSRRTPSDILDSRPVTIDDY